MGFSEYEGPVLIQVSDDGYSVFVTAAPDGAEQNMVISEKGTHAGRAHSDTAPVTCLRCAAERQPDGFMPHGVTCPLYPRYRDDDKDHS